MTREQMVRETLEQAALLAQVPAPEVQRWEVFASLESGGHRRKVWLTLRVTTMEDPTTE